ncbi:hypothetical protein [Stutzerimonas azotifigens]|uniref:Uncharacterized protein n=1 Tax=Stutzerimonas azotifigens TaxID=291995 RepID=A0ABR5Z768_9GAMM|nr:hypothetical protein [Stutzerimonas azotifigens]MBA1276073.1 hypothetical protein [Stutzerimonas azotifigens]
MNEKMKLSIGALACLGFCVLLTVNLFYPLSYESSTRGVSVGTGYQSLDIAAILYCAFMAYASVSTPHAVRISGRDVIFASFLNVRTISAYEIISVEKADFGLSVRFRLYQGSIKVNKSVINYELLNGLSTANPETKIVGL